MSMATGAKFKIESGVQLLARLSKKQEIVNFFPLLFEPGLKWGDTVEIFSDVNISYLLIDLICAALFPNNVDVNPTGVLFINTVGQFNYEEFVEILLRRLNNMNQASQMQELHVNEMLHKALSNFHLIEIYDATQFYTTIHNLDNILSKHPNISLLILDSLNAFYWSEQGLRITKIDLYIKLLLTLIQKISKEYKIIIIYTRPTYFSSNKDNDNLETNELTNGLNFKVQVVLNSKGSYGVAVKTSQTFYKKSFIIINNTINWK